MGGERERGNKYSYIYRQMVGIWMDGEKEKEKQACNPSYMNAWVDGRTNEVVHKQIGKLGLMTVVMEAL